MAPFTLWKWILRRTKEFTIKRYREEIGRDYKSIVLYLCFNDELVTSEIPVTDERSMPSRNDTEGLPETKVKLTQVTCDKILWQITSSSITQIYIQGMSKISPFSIYLAKKQCKQVDICANLISTLMRVLVLLARNFTDLAKLACVYFSWWNFDGQRTRVSNST